MTLPISAKAFRMVSANRGINRINPLYLQQDGFRLKVFRLNEGLAEINLNEINDLFSAKFSPPKGGDSSLAEIPPGGNGLEKILTRNKIYQQKRRHMETGEINNLLNLLTEAEQTIGGKDCKPASVSKGLQRLPCPDLAYMLETIDITGQNARFGDIGDIPWMRPKMGRTGQDPRGKRAARPGGRGRGTLSMRPPPVMWARPFT